MTGLTVFKFILETLAVALVGYCIYNEKSLAAFERKLGRFLKNFFKFCVSEFREKKKVTTKSNVVEVSFENISLNEYECEYEYLLNNVG